MIVPRERLLWTAALVGVPLITFAGVFPQFALAFLAILFLFCVVAFIDAQQSRRLLSGLAVGLPQRISLFKGRAGEIEVQIENARENSRKLRLGLNLPPSLKGEHEDMWVQLPAGTPRASLKWPCTPIQRGSYRVPSIHLETPSRLGLWSIRQTQPSNSELRIYPDLFADRKRVAMIFLHRRAFGIHAQRQVGKGRDFEKLRDYMHGDPLEDIHWKATAKRGRPVTKVFQIERTQEVYVVVDSSRLSARISEDPADSSQSALAKDSRVMTSTTVLDRFLTTALLLALATEQQGDHFGLVTFSDRVHSVIRARNGQSHFALCRDALFDLQPRLVTPDFEEVCSTIRVRLRKRALIIFLTPLDDPLLAESFVRSLDLISRQHLILVNMIEPGRTEPVFSNKTAPQSPQDIYEALAGHMVWQKLREIQKILEVRGVKFGVLQNEMLTREVVGQYLEVKQRQLI
jgi:uncharacterized protein (DUF58 family)